MLIRVMYHDFRYDLVKSFRLDEFLEEGRISMFRRRSGWVFVGIDPIRRNKGRHSAPYDRRRSSNDSQ